MDIDLPRAAAPDRTERRARMSGASRRPVVLIVEDDARPARPSRGSWSARLPGGRAPRTADGARAVGGPSSGRRAAGPRPAGRGWPGRRPPRSDGRRRRPIVILSGRYEEREKVEALERGADDYVTKPFGVDGAQRPPPGCAPPRRGPRGRGGRPDRGGPLEFDVERGTRCCVDGTRVDLTPREFEILRVLLAHRAASSPRAGCCGPCGARPTRARTATSTST